MSDTEFTVLAQAFVGTRRITKTVRAADEAAVLRAVSQELEDAGFYPVDISPAASKRAA